MISGEIYYRSGSVSDVSINKKEALHYMGINSDLTNEDFEALYDECLELFNSVVSYKACIAPFEVKRLGENQLDLGFAQVNSFHLCRNLEGMNHGFVFAATTGIQVDRLIMKYSKLAPSKAVVIDAISSAAIEGFCNNINTEFVSGRKTRFRFSPGYGDLPLDVQPLILEYLDAGRKLGITLSPNFFMTPAKSVTAIFGVGDSNQ